LTQPYLIENEKNSCWNSFSLIYYNEIKRELLMLKEGQMIDSRVLHDTQDANKILNKGRRRRLRWIEYIVIRPS